MYRKKYYNLKRKTSLENLTGLEEADIEKTGKGTASCHGKKGSLSGMCKVGKGIAIGRGTGGFSGFDRKHYHFIPNCMTLPIAKSSRVVRRNYGDLKYTSRK